MRTLTNEPFDENITVIGHRFTETRVKIIIESSVPICTTGREDPGKQAVKMLKTSGVKTLSIIPIVALVKRRALTQLLRQAWRQEVTWKISLLCLWYQWESTL